jgi:hypothetical protein
MPGSRMRLVNRFQPAQLLSTPAVQMRIEPVWCDMGFVRALF